MKSLINIIYVLIKIKWIYKLEEEFNDIFQIKSIIYIIYFISYKFYRSFHRSFPNKFYLTKFIKFDYPVQFLADFVIMYDRLIFSHTSYRSLQ